MSSEAGQRANTTLTFQFSGIGLCLVGLTPYLTDRLRHDWEPFLAGPSGGPPLLTLDLLYVEPTCDLSRIAFAPKRMTADHANGGACYRMPEGTVEVDRHGRATVHLMPEPSDRQFYTLVNLVRASLACRLPSRGAALLHAAGLVLDGRAFVLVGSEGTGKSTWARLGEQAGGRVVSDDLVLIDGATGEPELLGAPFRSTHRADYRPGRWPLVAVLFPRHGLQAAWSPINPLLSRARVLANLPFVAESADPESLVAPLVDGLVSNLPCGDFTFPPDRSFVAFLRGWSGRR